MYMPIAITTRQPSTVGRRPILSARPPRKIEPSAMPISSAESTNPSAVGAEAPLGSDAGRRKADREHVEAVERVQTDGNRDDDDLHHRHRRFQYRVTWIAMHDVVSPSTVTGRLRAACEARA